MKKTITIFALCGLSGVQLSAFSVNSGEQATLLHSEDFQSGVNPFTIAVDSDASTTLLSDFTSPGNFAVEVRDSAATDGGGSTFRYSLSSSNPFVSRINEVLGSAAGTSADFIFEFEIERTSVGGSPSVNSNRVFLQTFGGNDGNPPPGGVGRDRFWTSNGLPIALLNLPDYNTDGQLDLIDNVDLPQGIDAANPWRGYRFTVTSDGSGNLISSFGVDASVRTTSGADEAYALDNLAFYEVSATVIPEPQAYAFGLGALSLGAVAFLRSRRRA